EVRARRPTRAGMLVSGCLKRRGDRMTYLEKLATQWWSAWGGKVVLISAVLLATLRLGCSAPFMVASGPEHVAQKAEPRAFIADWTAAAAASNAPGTARVRLAAYKGGEEHENKDASPKPKQKFTLPMAIELCVNNNFRVLAGAERIRI